MVVDWLNLGWFAQGGVLRKIEGFWIGDFECESATSCRDVFRDAVLCGYLGGFVSLRR